MLHKNTILQRLNILAHPLFFFLSQTLWLLSNEKNKHFVDNFINYRWKGCGKGVPSVWLNVCTCPGTPLCPGVKGVQGQASWGFCWVFFSGSNEWQCLRNPAALVSSFGTMQGKLSDFLQNAPFWKIGRLLCLPDVRKCWDAYQWVSFIKVTQSSTMLSGSDVVSLIFFSQNFGAFERARRLVGLVANPPKNLACSLH